MESVGKERRKVGCSGVEGAVKVKRADVLTKIVKGGGGSEITEM